MTPVLLFVGFIGLVILWQVVRHLASARVAAAGVIIITLALALGTWLVVPGLLVATPTVPPGQLVGWELGSGFGGTKFDPATAQTTTVIPMVVDHPGWANERDWLGEPAIAYTPWSVTITMHARDANHDSSFVGWYLSGMYTQVQLSEPLGGRQLFDGSKSPPHPRSPGDPPYRLRSRGSASRNVASAPPQTKSSRPSQASDLLPNTGASRYRLPRAATACASRTDTAGSVVVESITRTSGPRWSSSASSNTAR